MSAPIKIYRKAVVERRRLYIDYSCWLKETEKLTDFQVQSSPYTAAAPIAVDGSYPDATNKQLMLFVSGGVANTDYTLSLIVRTDATQIKRDDIGVRVTP